MKQREPMQRSYMKRRPGRRLKAKRAQTVSALDAYFGDSDWRTCQICGHPLKRCYAQPCHILRSWKGLHGPEHLVAGHGRCHQWLDAAGSQGPRETFLRESGVSMATGGVVRWPEELADSLRIFIGAWRTPS